MYCAVSFEWLGSWPAVKSCSYMCSTRFHSSWIWKGLLGSAYGWPPCSKQGQLCSSIRVGNCRLLRAIHLSECWVFPQLEMWQPLWAACSSAWFSSRLKLLFFVSDGNFPWSSLCPLPLVLFLSIFGMRLALSSLWLLLRWLKAAIRSLLSLLFLQLN